MQMYEEKFHMRLIHSLVQLIIFISVAQSIKFETVLKEPVFAKPDNHGYRYCASWKLPDGTPIYSGCDPVTMDRCGKTLEFDYKCCSGFENSRERLGGPSDDPCAKMIPQFDDCASVVEAIGFSKMASYLREMPELNGKNSQPYTIFVPLPKDGSELEKRFSGNRDAVKYHVVKGRHYADNLVSGMTLESIYNNQKLDVFRSSVGSVSIECSELSQADIECKSGLIHIIRHSLIPRSGLNNLDGTSVMSLLRSNSETREFANDLPATLQRELENTSGGRKYTVMAPSATMWTQAKLGRTTEQIQKIAANHISVGKRCSSTLTKKSQTMNAVNNVKSKVQCSVENNKEVQQIVDSCGQPRTLTIPDITASNGVVHHIDGPLILSSAMTLKEFMQNPKCAAEQNIDKFINILKECDLYMEADSQYAIISPENSAFDWWKNYPQFRKEYERFQVDPEYRCRVARYHIVQHNGKLRNMGNFSGHTDGHRSNNKNEYLYETTYLVKDKIGSTLYYHFSPVNNINPVELSDSSIFRTSRINVIPEVNITDILETRPDLKHANAITKFANMEENVFKLNAPKNLYLVTRDRGWLDPRSVEMGKELNDPDLARYEGFPQIAEHFAKMSHVPLYLWGGDIGYFRKNSVHKFTSSAGIELTFWMDEAGVMRIGYDGLPKEVWPRVVEINDHARDGIVWTLDGILRCPEELCPFQLEDNDTYSFYTSACISTNLEGETDVAKNFAKTPIEIAKRHPDKCYVLKQGEVTTTKDIFEAGPVSGHDH